ncbi:helix-turn-helix domain-containing protein [Gloeobacter morelensis]|uniref:Helix-turn-helix domain-containing protein n=1 Tax=Gloeobacter morelensis MG652769 TaxID=2781736 RepID=A0ABY3PMJ6_9CYAN|nr:helix-turn-helix domain-containing protein [Gloeobacter morelensis]UFP94872.1 helix-turn-helix domain-containing protein [Gloeobacter morelensis MG652769]
MDPAMVKFGTTTGGGTWQWRFKVLAPIKAAANPAIASPADKIATVRAALSLNIKELAAILRVQRPTVYSWIEGEAEPQTENARRLNALFELARSWSGLAAQPLGEDVRRPHFQEGRSFAELLSEGDLNDPSLREKLRELEAAQRARTTRKKKSLRETLAEKGINLPRNSETVDMLTGKRISDE